VDWVFGSCRQVDFATGKVIEPSTFHVGGRPRPFLSLETRTDENLRIITDPSALECQILHGLYCGLQNSVMKRELFDGRRFNPRSRVVDDEIFVIRVLAAGARFAYFPDPHVVYRVHGDNSSASAGGLTLAKHVDIYSELTAALEQVLAATPSFSPRERRAMRKRLAREYFWHLGYVGYWQAGRKREAIDMFRRGLEAWPWYPSAWKTYLLARLKAAVQGAQ
jgi:tetratricopeptide (TPR) repeat protein